MCVNTGLRKHDVCFVLTVRAKLGLQERFDWSKSFVSQSGLEYVRGCEIEGMLDENGRVIEEGIYIYAIVSVIIILQACISSIELLKDTKCID